MLPKNLLSWYEFFNSYIVWEWCKYFTYLNLGNIGFTLTNRLFWTLLWYLQAYSVWATSYAKYCCMIWQFAYHHSYIYIYILNPKITQCITLLGSSLFWNQSYKRDCRDQWSLSISRPSCQLYEFPLFSIIIIRIRFTLCQTYRTNVARTRSSESAMPGNPV